MPLMVEKGIRGEICNAIHHYAKADIKYRTDHDKSKELSYLTYWEASNFYGQAMSQKLPLNKFEQIEETCPFNEDFIKTIMKKVMKDIFSKVMFHTLKDYRKFIMIYHFYQKE